MCEGIQQNHNRRAHRAGSCSDTRRTNSSCATSRGYIFSHISYRRSVGFYFLLSKGT